MYPALKKAGVEVMGISTDAEEILDRFRVEKALPFPLVADASGRLARAYGARWPIIGRARRVTYLVGEDRKIRLAFHSERDVTAHPARVLEAAGG